VNISQLIGSYGYWAIFALVGAESLGIPLPGETALVHRRDICRDHAPALAVAGLSRWRRLAAIIGDNIGLLDRRQGRVTGAGGPPVRAQGAAWMSGS